MHDVDCLVIGAGVVGLAVARALALQGRSVVVAESENAFGTGTSSRNSEVIHAGIYYPQGSLKAELCVRGRHALYQYCESRGIPHKRIGKLIVASNAAQAESIHDILQHGLANGVDDLSLIDGGPLGMLEPELNAVAAIHSPSTGIIDSHAYMLALFGDAENAGATIAFRSAFQRGGLNTTGVEAAFGDETLHARLVVNAAGLHAHRVAAAIEGVQRETIPFVSYAKGNYFGSTVGAPFKRLIYPVPEQGGLGVHLTLDMAGRSRFGPDVEWINDIDYPVDPARAAPFYAAIRGYWPGLPDDALFPDYAGIRVKLDGRASSDFRIESGHPGLINLYGIESPGLTASLALADHVAALAEQIR